MEGFPHPPWIATADETSGSDPATFGDCERGIEAFASQGHGAITERRYSISKTWGRVLRAKVRFATLGITSAALVTCWTGEGPGVRIAVEVDGCGPQQAGC